MMNAIWYVILAVIFWVACAASYILGRDIGYDKGFRDGKTWMKNDLRERGRLK